MSDKLYTAHVISDQTGEESIVGRMTDTAIVEEVWDLMDAANVWPNKSLQDTLEALRANGSVRVEPINVDYHYSIVREI